MRGNGTSIGIRPRPKPPPCLDIVLVRVGRELPSTIRTWGYGIDPGGWVLAPFNPQWPLLNLVVARFTKRSSGVHGDEGQCPGILNRIQQYSKFAATLSVRKLGQLHRYYFHKMFLSRGVPHIKDTSRPGTGPFQPLFVLVQFCEHFATGVTLEAPYLGMTCHPWDDLHQSHRPLALRAVWRFLKFGHTGRLIRSWRSLNSGNIRCDLPPCG